MHSLLSLVVVKSPAINKKYAITLTRYLTEVTMSTHNGESVLQSPPVTMTTMSTQQQKVMSSSAPTTSTAPFTESSDVVSSFGWDDFPLLLGHFSYTPNTVLAEQQQATPRSLCHCTSPNCAGILKQDTQSLPDIVEIDDSDQEEENNVSSPQIHKSQDTRTVRFESIQIREHAICLGDHPSCNSFPVTLDWAYSAEQVVTVDDYETQRRIRRCQTHGHHNPTLNLFRRHKPRRLSPLERRLRLEQVTDQSAHVLTDRERIRRLQAQRQRLVDANTAKANNYIEIEEPELSQDPLANMKLVHSLISSASAASSTLGLGSLVEMEMPAMVL